VEVFPVDMRLGQLLGEDGGWLIGGIGKVDKDEIGALGGESLGYGGTNALAVSVSTGCYNAITKIRGDGLLLAPPVIMAVLPSWILNGGV
jgi:hypothetical protein